MGVTVVTAEGLHFSVHLFLLSCSDHIDLINSVADLKLDNKRLQDMNKALQLQMEHSEENLKEIQTENKELKCQIREYVI